MPQGNDGAPRRGGGRGKRIETPGLETQGSRILNRGAKPQLFRCGRIRAPWRAIQVNKRRTLAFLAVATAFGLAGGMFVNKMAAGDGDDRSRQFRFAEDSLVLSKSVYAGSASTVIAGEALPPGCMGGATGLTVQVPLVAGGTV